MVENLQDQLKEYNEKTVSTQNNTSSVEKKKEPSPVKRLGIMIVIFIIVVFLSLVANIIIAAFLPENHLLKALCKTVTYACIGLTMCAAIKLSMRVMQPVLKRSDKTDDEIKSAFSDFVKNIANIIEGKH